MSQKHAPRGPLKHPMDGSHPMKAQCTATNRQQQRCKRAPIPGGTVCRMHGGAAPQVKEAAMERLRRLQHPAIDALEWLITQRDFPSAAMSAARDVMDRTEGKAPESLSLEVSGDDALIAALAAGRRRVADARKV